MKRGKRGIDDSDMIRSIIFVILLCFIGYITIAEAGDANYTDPITYVSYVDNGFGFYKARDVTTYKSAPLDPSTHTLTIKQGDRVIWKNDAERGVTLTVVSEQGLFADADLKSNFQYNFEQTGTFTFHIKEYPGKKFTVVVNAGDYPINTPNPTSTPTIYPTYTPTPSPTSTPTIYPIYTPTPSPTPPIGINIDIGNILNNILNPRTIISVMVAILSIFITYKGRNKDE